MAIGLYISFATSICETKKTLRTSNLWVFWVGFLTVSEDFWGSKKNNSVTESPYLKGDDEFDGKQKQEMMVEMIY